MSSKGSVSLEGGLEDPETSGWKTASPVIFAVHLREAPAWYFQRGF